MGNTNNRILRNGELMTENIDRTDPVQARKNAWHQSTLETLLDGCSWQYFLQYVLDLEQGIKPHSVVGTSFHSAVELHENARKNGISEGVSMEEMIEYALPLLHEKINSEEYTEMLVSAIKNWYGAPAKDGVTNRNYLLAFDPVAIEPYFNLPLVDGAKPIAGWIDGIYRHKETGSYVIVDQKTSSNMNRWAEDGSGHRNQATMYAVALALSPDFPEITDLLPMHYVVSRTSRGKTKTFEGARRVIVVPDYDDVKNLGDRIRKAEFVVANEEYVKKPEWGLCKEQWCSFYEKCMVTGELSGTPVTIRQRIENGK